MVNLRDNISTATGHGVGTNKSLFQILKELFAYMGKDNTCINCLYFIYWNLKTVYYWNLGKGEESINKCPRIPLTLTLFLLLFLVITMMVKFMHQLARLWSIIGQTPVYMLFWRYFLTILTFKNIYFCFTDYAKAFDCVEHNKLWEILKEMGIPDHLTCLLRNLYAGQEATVRTGHGITDGSK